MTDPATLDVLAHEMLGVFREHRLERVSDVEIGSLSLDEAYEIQDRVIAQRTAAGERPAGYKVGCTSPAIREQFGLTQPIAGRVMTPHVHNDGATIDIANFVRCAVEPELVVHIGRDLSSDADEEDIRSSITGISAGIEIHEYVFFHGVPTSQELIASNGIHAGLAVHPEQRALAGIDLMSEAIEICVNGEVRGSGTGADVMGDPMTSLRWLVGHLAVRGRTLRAGDLVIPGSATPLVTVLAGDVVESRFSTFGTCRVRCG